MSHWHCAPCEFIIVNKWCVHTSRVMALSWEKRISVVLDINSDWHGRQLFLLQTIIISACITQGQPQWKSSVLESVPFSQTERRTPAALKWTYVNSWFRTPTEETPFCTSKDVLFMNCLLSYALRAGKSLSHKIYIIGIGCYF